jgi:hypothetical protein
MADNLARVAPAHRAGEEAPMPAHVFQASRWTSGNLVFPTVIEVGDTFVVKRTRTLLSRNEVSIHLQRVASVRIETGVLWSNILIESSGGSDPIASHGHTKADAQEIKRLIESAQQNHLAEQAGQGEPGAAGDTRPCPYCAEIIKAAAKVCRFCNRDVSSV